MSDVRAAVDTIRAGGIVVVTDAENRENEGDLVMAAGAARQSEIAFFLRHTSGVLCAAMSEWRADDLRLPPMVPDNADPYGTAFTVTVDAADGISTGISAADRALTLRRLADTTHHGPSSFVRPGHVFPLRAREGGVLRRPGHTEATADLVRLAGLAPVGVLAEVTSPDKGRMANRLEIVCLAREFGLPTISIDDLIRYRLRRERTIEHVDSAPIRRAGPPVVAHAWQSHVDGSQHTAFVVGDPTGSSPTLVRVQAACTGEAVWGFPFCACELDLADAHREIAAAGSGVVVQLGPSDATVGRPSRCGVLDAVQTAAAATMLTDLGVRRVQVLTGTGERTPSLADFGVEVVACDVDARALLPLPAFAGPALPGCALGLGAEEVA